MPPIRAHFDGKVIILDEPLNLPAHQPLVLHIEQILAPEPLRNDDGRTSLDPRTSRRLHDAGDCDDCL